MCLNTDMQAALSLADTGKSLYTDVPFSIIFILILIINTMTNNSSIKQSILSVIIKSCGNLPN